MVSAAIICPVQLKECIGLLVVCLLGTQLR